MDKNMVVDDIQEQNNSKESGILGVKPPTLDPCTEIVIIGGGPSITEGISLGLKERIRDKFVIACNYSFYHFDSTLVTYVDSNFYQGILNENVSKIPDQNHINKLKNLPLIVGNRFSDNLNIYYKNTIPLKCTGTYQRDIKKGIYNTILVGLFSISLAMYLMDFKGTIFLLGFDWTKKEQRNNKPDTHYYKDINHRGIGYTSWYNRHSPEQYFGVFQKERDVKFYNVSLQSNINCFEKITYQKMFELISPKKYNQTELRNKINKKLSN